MAPRPYPQGPYPQKNPRFARTPIPRPYPQGSCVPPDPPIPDPIPGALSLPHMLDENSLGVPALGLRRDDYLLPTSASVSRIGDHYLLLIISVSY